jgi:NADH:ubiquinone reductase (H+-translocating)
MPPKRILVLGSGFAGLWSAVGAARKLDQLGYGPEVAQVTLLNRDEFHSIRVRNYEADLSDVRLPLADVLEPIGVQRVIGNVLDIDPRRRSVDVESATGRTKLGYDRLVFALGSQLVRPSIPGLAEFSFDVDTYEGAARLATHLENLSTTADSAGRWTVLIVGAGLTGIETAAEMPDRLRAVQKQAGIDVPLRVILADRNPLVGSDMGESARPVIEEALGSIGVELRMAVHAVSVDERGVTLASGERIEASTVIWCAGMRANPLAASFPVEQDRFGRMAVDEYMRVVGIPGVFAAGDVAAARIDGQHSSVMSCQHGRPMGRFAGHNVVCDLFGLPMLPLSIDWYVTVLDLGPWGAVYTNGWDRHVVAQGAAAKRTKQTINCQRIYPPRNRDRAEILAAAAPIVQTPPGYQA